jgi:hypothetical protein
VRIHVVRTGGFAGIAMRAEVDTTRLEPAEAETFVRQVAEAGFFNLPAKIETQEGGYDRFQYEIKVEDAGRSHTVACGEGGMDEKLSALVRQALLTARRTG